MIEKFVASSKSFSIYVSVNRVYLRIDSMIRIGESKKNIQVMVRIPCCLTSSRVSLISLKGIGKHF